MALPTQRSPLITVENEVYISDRRNTKVQDISEYVEAVDFDIDIDRQASKVDATVTTFQDVIDDGDWVSIYQRITPETGDIKVDQRGHVRINTPSLEVTGDGKEKTIGSGGDIIDELDNVILDRTFYTPKGGNIMEDVRYLIKMGTMGVIGQNLLENSSFENGFTGWWISQNSGGEMGTGVSQYQSNPPPRGESNFYALFSSTSSPGDKLIRGQTVDVLPVWIGNQGIWFSAVVWQSSLHDANLYIRFINADGDSTYPNAFPFEYYVTPSRRTGYVRVFFWSSGITSDATHISVTAGFTMNGNPTGGSLSQMDDVFLGTCIGSPLPDDRIDLPTLDRRASSPIIHKAGDTVLQAINDRLSAIGYHALYTKMNGVVTTRKKRSIDGDPPARIYSHEGDIRFSDVITVDRSAQNRYNRVVAIKESLEEGVDAMVAIAENTNSADPWSIYHTPQKTVKITVQDAETQEDLEAAAEAELDKAVEQEEVRFRITPDSSLSVHDIIQITGPLTSRIVGRWAVKSIRYGINEYDPTMEVVARRNKKALPNE